MSLIQEYASYRGVVMEHAVGATKESSLPQWVVKLRALQKYDFEEKAWVDWTNREDCEITGYFVLFSKKGEVTFQVKDIQNVFEWDGASLTGLDELDLEGAEVQFEVIANTYNNETRPKVARLSKYDDAPGSGAVRKLDAKELAALNTQFSGALKKLSGGPKPVKAPITAKGKKAAKTATTATAPPPAPPAKTEAEATTDAAAPVTEPVAENKEKNAKPTPPPAPGKTAAPPAPPKAPVKQAATEAPKGRELTYEQAWAECYAGKLPTVSNEQLATAFTGAMHRIAPKQTEDKISEENWGKIADTVLGECGGK